MQTITQEMKLFGIVRPQIPINPINSLNYLDLKRLDG